MVWWVTEIARNGELIGVFVVSLVSNAIPYSTIPYLFWLIPFFMRLRDTWMLAIAVLVSAVGASLGKLVVYFVGRGLSTVGRDSRFKHNIAYIVNKHEKATFLTVLLAAALPIPDDVVYIPVGYARYNLALFFIALLTGKIIITSMAAIYGRALAFLFRESYNLPGWLMITVYIVLTILITYIVGSVDWLSLGNTIREKGLREGIIELAREVFTALKKLPGNIMLLLRKLRIHGSHSASR